MLLKVMAGPSRRRNDVYENAVFGESFALERGRTKAPCRSNTQARTDTDEVELISVERAYRSQDILRTTQSRRYRRLRRSGRHSFQHLKHL